MSYIIYSSISVNIDKYLKDAYVEIKNCRYCAEYVKKYIYT